MSGVKAWGVPLYTTQELLDHFDKSTLFPDQEGEVVVVRGCDTLVFARNAKNLDEEKLYLVVDTPIILRGCGLQMNGVSILMYGRHVKTQLKKSPPKKSWKLPSLTGGVILQRNAERISRLLKEGKKLQLKVKGPMDAKLRAYQAATAEDARSKKKAKANDD